MSLALIIGWIGFAFLALSASAFCITFAAEQERRATIAAALISSVLLVFLAALLTFNYPGRDFVVIGLLAIIALLSFLALAYKGSVDSIHIVGSQRRVDERDAFFHRFFDCDRAHKTTPPTTNNTRKNLSPTRKSEAFPTWSTRTPEATIH